MKRLPFFFMASLAVAAPFGAAGAEGRVLTLDEALRLARANHPQLQAVHAQTQASVAKIQEARASLLPQVSGNATYTRSEVEKSTAVNNNGNAYDFGLAANQLLYDFGQTTGKWNAAKSSLRQQEESERYSIVQVSFALRSAYYAAAASRALLKVAHDNLLNQEAHLRQIQGFVEAGTRPEIDLAQARTDHANARVQLIHAQVNYDSAKAVVNQAMGVESATDFDVADPDVAAVEGENDSIDVLLLVALKARPDLLALAHQVESQQFLLGSIKGSYAPTLSASAKLNESGSTLDELKWGFRGMLSLNWQLFGGGITDAQVRAAQADGAALRAQYELQRQQIRLEAEQARLGVRAAKAAVEAAREAAVNARVRLNLAEGRYQAGVGSVIELGDSQVALTTAAAQEVQAIFTLATARAKLLLALGQP